MIALALTLAAQTAAIAPSDLKYVGAAYISACQDGQLQIDPARMSKAVWDDLPKPAQIRYTHYHFQTIYRFAAAPSTFLAIFNAEGKTEGYTNACILYSQDVLLPSLWQALSSAQAGYDVRKEGPQYTFIEPNLDERYLYAGHNFDSKNSFVETLHLSDAQMSYIKRIGAGGPAYLAFAPVL